MWWGPTKAFCHSVNVHGVVVLFAGGGDTSTLNVITKLSELFAPRHGGEQKTSSNCMVRPRAHPNEPPRETFSLPDFTHLSCSWEQKLLWNVHGLNYLSYSLLHIGAHHQHFSDFLSWGLHCKYIYNQILNNECVFVFTHTYLLPVW